ncbi:hypothetical protein OIU78_019197 [Salix suchowensis]|nr:hypothetical protein OIU78_019197 [Salix suchowensis]
MVWKVKHEEFESSIACDDGIELRASLVVDASGFASTFTEYDKPRNNGYQIAHGILAEVDHHPFDLDKMRLETLHSEGVHRLSEMCCSAMSQLLMLGKSVIFNCNKARQEETDGDIVDIDWPEDFLLKKLR